MKTWKIWIDTGGTFTDCIALDPGGQLHRTKVLSNSSLRGRVMEWLDERTAAVEQDWKAPPDFIKGCRFRMLHAGVNAAEIRSFDPEKSLIGLSENWTGSTETNWTFEITSDDEAPILAARLATRTAPGRPLPAVDLRLATTRGTNALLERKGTPVHLFVTEGFKDLLNIGDQKRPDLFALEIKKPSPLYERVVEVPERIDARGKPVRELDAETLKRRLSSVEGERTSAAVCLMNSYKNSSHEARVKELLQEAGYRYISVSTELNSFIKILPRAQTTVANAYLAPVLREYLGSIKQSVSDGSSRMMTSAGGLVTTERFHPKDSLLSGPAGGVVGASTVGKQAGFDHVLSFDMGGTSTDVARYDNEYDYVFEHKVGDATLAAPALSIETVAAGGGSICSFDGFKLTVGPASAGADPGPACYGAGGPLTLTDVNLLLGRLEPDNFGIPVGVEAAEEKCNELMERLDSGDDPQKDRRQILEGFLDIANERMADAIRKISLRKGYDPAEYALVAFGGAGAQHACAIANQLDIQNIVVPADAGLLSAYGLGSAVIEEFAEQQVLKPLAKVESDLPERFIELGRQAFDKLRREGVDPGDLQLRRQSVFLRLAGQESTLEIAYTPDGDIRKRFREAYRNRYGHWIEHREIEVESIRVIASEGLRSRDRETSQGNNGNGRPLRNKTVIFSGEERETPLFRRSDLQPGRQIEGPALILDPYSTIVLEPSWSLELLENGSLLVTRKEKTGRPHETRRAETVALELFTNRFTSIAEEMGEILRRTALSVNVKERMDYSCALLDAGGELVVNAPHIPVHLGALGLCVRRLQESIEMKPGDVVFTNHPAFGGSHLPDVTVVTPVFGREHRLVGFAASRAHHAEIGGARPGSMPPDASRLAEEGVVIPPMHLIREGKGRWEAVHELLASGSYPSRAGQENMADLRAAVAANHRGAQALLQLIDRHSEEQVLHYMGALRQYAADKMRSTLQSLPDGTFRAAEKLDDGTPLKVQISVSRGRISFDFDGTGGVHPGNLNATPSIVNSVIIYLLRLLIDETLPLNEGLLDPVDIHLPRSLLNPEFSEAPEQCPAVVGGNVETSQRLVDLLLKPFEKIACSQGTMNNVLFGNASFGYYETIGGGTGAGPGFHGADAVHHHMTNTAGTDPEILEQRYPVRLDRYAIRRDSGGSGTHSGGNGIERELTFMEPVSLSVLTQHRVETPYGLEGGKPGARGRQWVIRKNGKKEELRSVDGKELKTGDRFVIHTPGGGGFGSVD